MTISERIKNRRIELGMTQEELAAKLGYTSKTTIAKIEANANQLRQSKIKAMADALNTTPGYIMGWSEPEFVPTEGEVKLIEMHRRLDRQAQNQMMQMYALLLKKGGADES